MNYDQYISDPSIVADNQARIDFGKKLFAAFKIKNISEGIQWYQALWLHNRLRAWVVTLPVQLGGAQITVDLVNMMVAGDLETTSLALTHGQADDMSSPLHWASQARIDWVNDQLKRELGWIA